MSKILKKLQSKGSVHGFTLIELLVVIAIIGLLSTIIAAPIQSARKKARDAKKIAELKSTQLALEQYAESNKAEYPVDLALLSPQFMPLLSSFAASTTSNARDAFMYVYYTASSTGAADQIFSYHIGAKLEVYGPALQTDRDCTGVSLTALAVPVCAAYFGNNIIGNFVDNGNNLLSAGASWTAANGGATTTIGSYPAGVPSKRDFEGQRNFDYINLMASKQSPQTEESSSTCVITTSCIFDTTSQQ